MSKKQEFFFRPVGFREVFDLLDLDRFDAVLLEDMSRTNERINSLLIEIFERDSDREVQTVKHDEVHPMPVAKNCSGIGKSLGKMDADTARMKFL